MQMPRIIANPRPEPRGMDVADRRRMRWTCGVLLACAACVGGEPDSGGPVGPGGGKGDGGEELAFSVNDVSILFPLPANDSERARFLWLVPRAGEVGPAFPTSAIEDLPALNGDVPDSLGYPSAMVTGVRFDPCFPRLGGDTCQAQLRLVAQPVLTSANEVRMLEDAAAHLFYELDAAEAEQVIAKLAAIRDASPVATSGPLRVHPGLAADLAGATGDAVRALVVEHCRDDNLIRITANSFAFDNWAFTKLDRVDGRFVRQPLTGMAEPSMSQAWLRQAFVDSLDDPSGTIDPAPANGFAYLLSIASFDGGAPRDPQLAREAADRVLAIENPTLTSTEDVDCASCHVATQARLFGERNGVDFSGANRYAPPAGVDTALVLDPKLGGNLGATISFGYHMQDDIEGNMYLMPSLSQRTINESAEVAAFLSAL